MLTLLGLSPSFEIFGGNWTSFAIGPKSMGSHTAIPSMCDSNAPLRYQVHVCVEVEDTILPLICFCRFDFIGPVFQKLPEYLSRTQYRCPTSKDGPLQHAWDTKLSGFDYLMEPQHADTANDLNLFMKGRREGCASWLDFYPFAEEILAGSKCEENSVTVVDVGGGLGHGLLEICKRIPEIHGRLILQDFPKTVQQAVADVGTKDKFEPMAHDFFSPQPIHGIFCSVFIKQDIRFVNQINRRQSLPHSTGPS